MRTLLAFAGALLFAGVTAVAQPEEGLVLHYTFDEGQGGVLKDHSGRGNDGKILGAPEWIRQGKVSALKFDGKDDVVEIPTTSSLNVARAGTAEVWLNPAAHQGGVLCWHTGSGWLDERLVLVWYSGPGLACYASDGTFFAGSGWPPVDLNKWVYVAITWDGKTMRTFQDGRLLNEFDQKGLLDFGGAPLRLGQSRGLGPAYYSGLLGDVKVHSRALSPAEVFDSYAAAATDMGKPVVPGTKQLKAWTRLLLEDGEQVVLTADVAEFRPITQGMTLEAELPGTPIKKRVPIEPTEWRYEVALPAAGLAPGKYALVVSVRDAAGKPLAASTEMEVVWHKLSARHSITVDEAAKKEDVFDIVRDGRAWAVIVVPHKCDKWTRTAADWLAKYVKDSSGATLAVLSETVAPTRNLISVGQTEMMKKAGLTLDGLHYDGGRMVVRGNTLFLFGRDELQFDLQGAKGTCRTVTQFLEECVGVRWYLPGPAGAVVPRRTTVAVPKTLDHICNPAFGYCHGRYTYGANTPAAFANNWRTGIKILSHGGHSYYGWLPKEKYFNDHPEYFALIRGKRVGEGNHLCSSNPDVARILLDGIRKEFDQGYDWVQLGQEDGYARCECPRCEALDDFRGTVTPEAPCERLLLLHKWIADECRKSHPTKTVHLLVYGPTVWPSRKFDRWGDNVVAEMCSWAPEVVDAWKGKVRGLSGYIYWFDTTVGAGMSIHATAAEAAEKMRYLHASGYIGLYQCAGTNWGLQGPVYYIIGKALGDPYLDYRELQKEYCLGVFGNEAGETMNEFFTTLYAMPDVHTYVWPEATLEKLEALLVKAEGQVRPGRAQQWVRLTRNHFDFSKDLSRVLASYRAYKETPNNQTWATLGKSVDAFEKHRAKILNYPEAQADRYFPGYDEFCRFLASKYVGYYDSYKAKRAAVLKQGVRGTPIGWSIGGGIARDPLGMDFTKPPPHATPKK